VQTILAVLLLSYLLGSIPTSIITSRLIAGIDIREHGSGNAGATNVYRILGVGPAIVVGLIDVAKGVAAALLVSRISINGGAHVSETLLQLIAGGAAVIGHIWTVFAGFRGGKGMATAIGALAGVAPAALATGLVVWIVLIASFRIMSVASLGAATILPVAVWLWESKPDGTLDSELFWFSIILGALIWFTHRGNIRRLIAGEENVLDRRPAGNGTSPANGNGGHDSGGIDRSRSDAAADSADAETADPEAGSAGHMS